MTANDFHPSDLGPQPRSSDALTRRYRLQQSRWRAERLHEPCGPLEPGGPPVGSMIEKGEETGRNFLSEVAFAYAKERVAASQSNPGLTINAYRLFNNLLSSMPLCFNLFSDLRAGVTDDPADTCRTLSAMFPGTPIARVDMIELEMLPQPICDYLDDLTAFDAAVFFGNPQGGKCLLSIETKYTDKLGRNKAVRQGPKFILAREMFTPVGFPKVAESGFDQLTRNLLLTVAYARRHKLAWARNVVVAPAEDTETAEQVHRLQDLLVPDYRSWLAFRSLEDVIADGRAASRAELRRVLDKFAQRYLVPPIGRDDP